MPQESWSYRIWMPLWWTLLLCSPIFRQTWMFIQLPWIGGWRDPTQQPSRCWSENSKDLKKKHWLITSPCPHNPFFIPSNFVFLHIARCYSGRGLLQSIVESIFHFYCTKFRTKYLACSDHFFFLSYFQRGAESVQFIKSVIMKRWVEFLSPPNFILKK